LEGEANSAGSYAIWQANKTGFIANTAIDWLTADELAEERNLERNWEEALQIDLNGDEHIGPAPVTEDPDRPGIVDSDSDYRLFNNNAPITLYSVKGKGKRETTHGYNDQSSRDWDLAGALTVSYEDDFSKKWNLSDPWGFELLLKNEAIEQSYALWHTENDGRILSTEINWLSADELAEERNLQRNWERALQTDLNDDGHIGPAPITEDPDRPGIVDSDSDYRLYNEGDPVTLFTLKGKGKRSKVTTYSDHSSRDWDITAATKHQEGFDLLISNEANPGQSFAIWEADKDGLIKNTSIHWITADELAEERNLERNWEEALQIDLNGDGYIGPAPVTEDVDRPGLVDSNDDYRLYNNGDPITMFSSKGKGKRRKTLTYNDESSKDWNAIAARSIDNGFEALIAGERSLYGHYAVWEVEESGRITTKLNKTSWIPSEEALELKYDQLFGIDSANF